MKKKILTIGLTGPNAAGKGLAAQFFIEKGYFYFSLSDVVREEALKLNRSTSREDLIITGIELRQRYGYSILAERTFEKLKEKNVVDSFRHPEEVKFFKQNCLLFYLIGIDAPVEIRYERAKKRRREGDSTSSLKEFIEKEEKENADGAGQQLKATFNLADEVVINDGPKEDLPKKLESIYNKLEKLFRELKGESNGTDI